MHEEETIGPIDRQRLIRIGGGAEADVFALDDHHVLRLMRAPGRREHLAHEAAAMSAAAALGLRVPEPGQLMELDGREGLVMSRLHGVDGLTLLGRMPWLVWAFGQQLGRLHRMLGDVRASESLPNGRGAIWHAISRSERVPVNLRPVARRLLDILPEGDRLLHGDLHPGNLILQDGEPWIIDWPHAARGAPLSDFARTSLLLELGSLGASGRLRRALVRTGRSVLRREYERTYRSGLAIDETELARWQVVHAVQRFAERHRGEAPLLERYIARRRDAINC